MVRICDGRMSGTAYGTVVLHVAPEAAAGGPLGAGPDRRRRSSSTSRPGASTSTSQPTNWPGARPTAATVAGFAQPAARLGTALRRPRHAGRHRRRPRLPRRIERVARRAASRTEPRPSCDSGQVNYEEAAAVFLAPSVEPISEPAVPQSSARRLRDALEPIATIGWWAPASGAQAAALGLDFLGNYLWGRAAALGADVEPAVVTSAFGVFDDAFIRSTLTAARAKVSHADIIASRERGATDGLAAAADEVDLDTITMVGDRLLVSAADLDGAARPLFSGVRALPVPSDPYGRLWRGAELFREHRGDGHLAACATAGLDAVQMNIMTELWLDYPLGEYSGSRAFSDDRIDAAGQALQDRGWLDNKKLTAPGRDQRELLERATDASQAAFMSALGADVAELIDAAARISAAVVASHAAPSDPRKRAAG